MFLGTIGRVVLWAGVFFGYVGGVKCSMEEEIVFRYDRQLELFSWDRCVATDYVPRVQLEWSGPQTIPLAQLHELQAILTTYPENLLHENVACVGKLARTVHGIPLLTDALARQLIVDYPLCLLNECHDCLLTRLTRLGAMARDMFEREMVLRVTDGYVNVGGGMAFQDLVLMTQVLRKNPCATLTVYLVDPMHEHYIEAAHRHGCAIIDMTQGARQLFFEDWYSQDDFARIQFSHELFKQMISFLRQLYPKAQLHISLYRYVEDLLKDCERGIVSLPQVVMSSDLGKSQDARDAFANLVRFALAYRQDAIGMSLDKEKPTDSAMVHIWTNKTPSC